MPDIIHRFFQDEQFKDRVCLWALLIVGALAMSTTACFSTGESLYKVKSDNVIEYVKAKRRAEVPPPPFGILATTGDMTVEDWVASAARVNGEVEWFSFQPPRLSDHVKCVQADIKTHGGRTYEVATVQFLVNQSSGAVEVNYVEVDGVNSVLSGSALFLDRSVLK